MTAPTVHDQAAKLVGPISGTATVLAVELGLQLGLFDEIARCPDGAWS